MHWDIESGEVINVLQATDSDINGNSWDIAISPDGKSFFFVTARNDDSGVYQFDIETLTEMNSFSTNRDDDALYSVALTPDGHSILATSSSGDVILFDLDTGEVIRRYNLGGFSTNVEISADGERFVAPVGNGSAMLVDIASGEVIRTFDGHTDFVSNVVFTPDESQIVISSGDGTLILWDVASGEALRTYSEHDAWVNRLALSPDGTLAYSTADDGTVIVRSIIEAPVDEILAYIAANRVLPDFNCLERKQYRILPLCDADGVVPDDN
ncbi:WD40 repeat domain-containing protein [Candidatus Leptofilum sp.]|uniref:WD40 repeat domain-containing protein n=1 Tax=Candidatus Leptofilum sp. TaxID=3241576 RepID=UPI003B5A1839